MTESHRNEQDNPKLLGCIDTAVIKWLPLHPAGDAGDTLGEGAHKAQARHWASSSLPWLCCEHRLEGLHTPQHGG